VARKGEIKIEKPNIIICEGLDTKLFMIHCLAKLKNEYPILEQFQAIDGKGVANIPKFIRGLDVLPYFEMVKSIIIIRDADDDATDASHSLKNALRKCGFAVPEKANCIAKSDGKYGHISVAYLILPDVMEGMESGTLEDFCITILDKEQKTERIVGQAEQAVENLSDYVKFRRKHKNILHTYLSLTNKYVGLKIGESAQAGAYDFSSDEVNVIRDLMLKISEEN
jgi:hypothetical protein